MTTKEKLEELRAIRQGQLSIMRCAISDMKNPKRVEDEVQRALLSIAKQQEAIIRKLGRLHNGQDIIEAAEVRVKELNQQIKILEHQHKIERLRALEAQMRELQSDPEIERLASVEAQQ